MKKATRVLLLLLCAIVSNPLFAQDGANDPTFNPDDAGFANGVDVPVSAVAVQPDGKILLCGGFVRYKGYDRKYITRINPDESIDLSFNTANDITGNITSVAIQSDGKIIIAGYMNYINGTSVNRLVRLNTDGSLDTSFTAVGDLSNGITAMILQPDGKIVVGGYNFVKRFNSNGTQDMSFSAGAGPEGFVSSLGLQPDGKILAGGSFASFNGSPNKTLVRLETDGSIDSSFGVGEGASTTVSAIEVTSDNKIYVGGVFQTFNNQSLRGVLRLNQDGAIDNLFNIGNGVGINGYVSDITLQPDGKLIAAGRFKGFNGQSNVNDIVRINPDGSLDSGFISPTQTADDGISDIEILNNGNIVIAGVFSKYNDTSRNYTALLNNDGTLNENFTLGAGPGADNVIKVMLPLQEDEILIAGDFNYYNGIASKKVAVINGDDGSIVSSFNVTDGPNGIVNSAAIQQDGKIVIIGDFNYVGAIPRNGIARLNVDGSLDESYQPNLTFNKATIAIQSDGKVIVAGYNSGGNNMYRLNTDGTIDNTFTIPSFVYNLLIMKIIVQSDDRIIVANRNGSSNSLFRLNTNGGLDTTFAGVPENVASVWGMTTDNFGNIYICGFNNSDQSQIAKLDSNGVPDTDVVLDPTFNPFGSITNIKVQGDGKIIVFGSGNIGMAPDTLVRLNADGTLDDTFDTGEGVYGYKSGIYDVLLLEEDKILIAGGFIGYNNIGRNRIAKLNSTGALDVDVFSAVKDNDIVVYKDSQGINISSINELLSSVQVYDMAGRLLVKENNINKHEILVNCIGFKGNVLIVKTILKDGTVSVKKIF
ncbi:hypothetical protein GWA97_04125 [Flavobacterium sp. LaA7.5]|nr:hypothetical protein [Flavobacterium salilacus subsp. altitudinum]